MKGCKNYYLFPILVLMIAMNQRSAIKIVMRLELIFVLRLKKSASNYVHFVSNIQTLIFSKSYFKTFDTFWWQ